MMRQRRALMVLVAVTVALSVGITTPAAWAKKRTAGTFSIAKIYFEYNSSANDLGVHVLLDAEDWNALSISNPRGRVIFDVEGRGPYREFGLTELFFEGAEPNLDDVSLETLLAEFPAGHYRVVGRTVDKTRLESTARLSHAIPAGPSNVEATFTAPDQLVVTWSPVTGPPPGFPDEPINIVGYQVIVGSFQVTVPATTLQVTVPREFVASLPSGERDFEVLAIEASGNQTITEGVFTKP